MGGARAAEVDGAFLNAPAGLFARQQGARISGRIAARLAFSGPVNDSRTLGVEQHSDIISET
jgi:hypothetical protein